METSSILRPHFSNEVCHSYVTLTDLVKTQVWDESWSLKHVFVGHCAKVTQLLYYVPDNCIISASVDKTIRLWSLVFLDLMQCIQTWSMTLGLGILPDNSTLYSFGDHGVEVWEMKTLHKSLCKSKYVISPF